MNIDDIDNISDVELEKKILAAATSINAMIDKTVLINFIRETVDNAKCIEFASDRSRKFISKKRPTFSIRFKPEDAVKIYGEKSKEDFEEYTNYRSDIIREELILPINYVISGVMQTVFEKDSTFEKVEPSVKEVVQKIIGDRDLGELLESCNQIFVREDVSGEFASIIAGTIVGLTFVPEGDSDPEVAIIEIML